MKKAYNVLISREQKAEIFFKNEKVSQVTKEAWIPEFNTITECLSLLMRDYKKLQGINMTDTEVLTGFKDVM